jgi:hypothetical protein
MPGAARTLTSSERDWLGVRSYLAEHRDGLAVDAAGDYPPAARIAGTPLLAAPGWRPDAPVRLQDMLREFAEELCGRPEEHGGPVGYDSWPFARQLTGARDRGQIRVWCLGLGTDPLTCATDLLTATKDVARSQAEVLAQVLCQPEQADDDAGGEPACWAHLVCPQCGAMVTEGHAAGCAAGA